MAEQTSNEPWAEFVQATTYLEAEEAQQYEERDAAPWNIYRGVGTSYLGMGTPPQRSTITDQRGGPSSEDERFNRVFSRLIQQESRGRHRSSSGELTASPVGAQGITQVMPDTGTDPGYGIAPLRDDSEEEYIRFGRDYLGAMLNEFDGDYEKALAAYNAGPGNVQKAITRGGANWKDFLPKRKETIPYIENILNG